MAGQPPPDGSWRPGQEQARAAWQPHEQPPYEPLAETAKHPVQSFDAPPPAPPGEPGRGYPPPRGYGAGAPAGYAPGGPGYGAPDHQPSFDLPGHDQQAAWQTPGQAQARPAAPRGKGFVASLFDFGFTSFVTPKLVKALYFLATLWTVLWALILVRIGFHYGATAGLFMLILVVPVFGLLSLGTIRVFLELFMVLHRINENIQSIRDRDGG
jgi:hypothetical protein